MNSKERQEYAKRTAEFSKRLLISGKHKKAEHLMQKAIHFAPELAIYYNQYGVLLMYLSRFKEAKDHFNKAIGLCPVSDSLERELMAHTYHNRGICFLLEGLLEPALSDAVKAVELSPKNVNFWQQKSFVLLHLGDFVSALESAEIAIMLDDSLAHSRYLCALVHFFLHNFKESLREVETGLKLAVNDRSSADKLLEIKKQISDILRQYGDALPDNQQKERVLH